jgi:hypothetical protein
MRTPMRSQSTAAVAALGLLGGYGIAVASGSRALGGLVLALAGLWCVRVWLARDGPRAAAALTLAGLAAFAISHALGLAIGAWPAVVLTSCATAALYWSVSDAAAWNGQRAGAR